MRNLLGIIILGGSLIFVEAPQADAGNIKCEGIACARHLATLDFMVRECSFTFGGDDPRPPLAASTAVSGNVHMIRHYDKEVSELANRFGKAAFCTSLAKIYGIEGKPEAKK